MFASRRSAPEPPFEVRPRTAPLPVAASTRGGVTTVIPRQRASGSDALDAPTVRLPIIGGGVDAKQRVRGLDAARGLALLGMIAVHTFPLSSENGITTVGLLAGGTSAALFAVLAGVSVALLTSRRRVALNDGTAARHGLRLVVRGLVVGALGLALGEAALGSVDIILTYYGVLFVLAALFVVLPTRALVALGALLAVVAPVTSFLIRAQLPATELIDPSFTALVTDPGGLLTTIFLTGAYPIWPWLAYLCAGIAIGRCSLDKTCTARWLLAIGVSLVVAATTISRLALTWLGGLNAITANPGLPAEELRAALTEGPNGVTPTTTWWWLAVDTAHSSTPLSLVRTIGTSLAVLGVMLLIDRGLHRARSNRALQVVGAARAPLAAAGAMTLTFYTLHVVVAGLASETELEPWLLYLVQVVVALFAGLLWQHHMGRGPLEAGLSRLVDAVVSPVTSRGTLHAPTRKRAWTLLVALAVAAVVGVALAAVDGPLHDSLSTTTSEQAEAPEIDETTGPADQLDQPDQLEQPGPPDEPEGPEGPDTGPGEIEDD